MNATHVLIVEDNHADARIIRMALAAEKDWHTTIAVADDGEKAINYLRRNPPYDAAEPPDLVILDLNLPKYDGTEVLGVIRSIDSLREMPVVVLSSAPMNVLKEKVRDAGLSAQGYLTKPMEFKTWMTVGQVIRRCYTEGATSAS